MSTVIAACVFLSYFIESAFGFGGTILFLASISTFMDLKDAVMLATYASMCASLCILFSGYKAFSLSHMIKIFAYAFPGVMVGVWVFTIIDSTLLLKLFAVFLILHSLYSLMKPALKMPYIASRFVLFMAGILHGLYATGAPFVLMAYKHEFQNKLELRTNIAAFLLFGNVIRLTQIYFMGDLNVGDFVAQWWLVFPILIAVLSGYIAHVKMNETFFSYGIYILMMLAGVFYLVK